MSPTEQNPQRALYGLSARRDAGFIPPERGTIQHVGPDRLTALRSISRAKILLFVLGIFTSFGAAGPAAAAVDYARDIKPMLRDRCYACHSRLKQKGGLRLDAGVLIHKGGKEGAIIKPGRSAESTLLSRVLSTDESERMPPEGKPLTVEQIALLKDWIEHGASFPKNEPVPLTPAEHWAFQPVRNPSVPDVKHAGWARNPIDHFVLARLEAQGWTPASPAEPRAWLRRVYLDLIGLPPSPAEVEAFLRNTRSAPKSSANIAAKIIDELLARPAYGERWARHWLDVVRYADSNGYERDAEKPFVWRYRDYVIEALNSDTPFDRFILEQLAGDELPDASAKTVIATGFHRLGHWDDEPADPQADRFDQLDDMVSTVSQAFLGLTLGCARCHDHKFEPLTTRDYYSMVAIFNPLQRPQNGRSELTLPAGRPEQLAALTKRDAEITRVQQQTNTLALGEIEKRIRQLRQATPDLPQAYVLQEPSTPPPVTHVLLRGSPSRPGDVIAPAVPALLVKTQPPFSPGTRTSQRRLNLARWLVGPENPLTARVIVNRVWQHHFGQGLVRTPNDFGLMGDPPTHPELLDWLATWFVQEAHWSIKKLHRLILTSATYGMSTTLRPACAAQDPEDRFLWRMPYRRLDVEVIRDSMLAVSGQLNPKMGGPAMKPRIPQAALEANTDKETIWKPSDDRESARRTIYVFIKRGLVVPMLEVLDLGDTVNSCPQRQITTVAPQALTLFNSEFVNAQARALAARLALEAGPNAVAQVKLAYQLALGRPPTKKESDAMLVFRRDEARRTEAAITPHPVPATATETAALEQMCRVILNLNEFVYAN